MEMTMQRIIKILVLKFYYFLVKDGGHQFTINGHLRSFAGTVAFVSGDNLGSKKLEALRMVNLYPRQTLEDSALPVDLFLN